MTEEEGTPSEVHDDSYQEIKSFKSTSYPVRTDPNYIRVNMREILPKELQPLIKSEKNSIIVEKCVYNAALTLAKLRNMPTISVEFKQLYADIAYSVLTVITPANVKTIVEDLKQNKIDWQRSCFADHHKRLALEENPVTLGEIEEGIYTCGKCQSKKTTSFAYQKRSADEPMTIYVTCAVCRNKWTMNN